MRRLASFQEVEVRAPVGPLAVVDRLPVVGVLVRPPVQGQGVLPVRLQRFLGGF